MVKWKILQRESDRYRKTAEPRHPQFPFVRDILAYQAAFLEETIENAGYAERPGWRNAFESERRARSDVRIRSFDSPVGADHAVRRNEKSERRCAHGCGNATMRARTSDRARDVGVRNELAKAECCDGAPRCERKRRPVEKARQIEAA